MSRGGLPDAGLTDEERWTEARARVARTRPRTAEASRGSRRQVAWLSGVVVVLAALSLVLAVLKLWSDGPDWRQPVAWVVTALLGALSLGSAVVAWGSGTLANSWLQAHPVLTRAQRREVAAGLRGTVPVHPDDVPLVREWALYQVAQLPLVLVVAGLQQVRMGDLDGSLGAGWFAWLFFVVWLGALGFFGVQVRRAHRFLRAHQEPTAG